MPGGAVVDAARFERFVAGIAVVAICVSALDLCDAADLSHRARRLRPACACKLRAWARPRAAISLGLVGHALIGERLGRNARFASVGNGLAAAVMGAVGYLLSARAVFVVTVFSAGAGARRATHHRAERDRSRICPRRRAAAPRREAADQNVTELFAIGRCSSSPAASCCFILANASMLPLMGSVLTMRSSRWATVLIAACIVVPQLVVALPAGESHQLPGVCSGQELVPPGTTNGTPRLSRQFNKMGPPMAAPSVPAEPEAVVTRTPAPARRYRARPHRAHPYRAHPYHAHPYRARRRRSVRHCPAGPDAGRLPGPSPPPRPPSAPAATAW